MSGDSTNDWKTKYLTVLEEMEASEEKERANQKLMQRAIVRVCLAADGRPFMLEGTIKSVQAWLMKMGGENLRGGWRCRLG